MLIGKQRAGKDIAADYLAYNYRLKKLALAQGVYEIAHRYFGMRDKDRGVLIGIGEKLRTIDPLVWVKYTLSHVYPDEDVIISDVRMHHEYTYLAKQGFIPVYIHAPAEVRARRVGYNPEFEYHPTEPAIEEVEDALGRVWVVKNAGTFREFYIQLDHLMMELDDVWE